MERVLINDVKKYAGKDINIQGRILNVRKLGKVIFIILFDRSGEIQSVWSGDQDVKIGDIIEITGKVKEEKRAKGGYEIEGKKINIISKSSVELPFDLSKKDINLNLHSLLDYRVYSVRHPKIKAIFKLYDILLKAYENVMREEGFTEIKTPKLLASLTEGGANFFKVKYFEKEAYLAQSPQFYKQIMVGALERVFEIGPVFRAEPHFTTRHLNEYISLDAEMGFIKDENDVMDMLNIVISKIFKIISEEGKQYLDIYNIKIDNVPANIPKIKLTDARKIIYEKYNYKVPENTDIDPEGERLVCQYSKEKYNSDFVFVTNYPWSDRPFYTMPADKKQKETLGFDLLYKNMEIVTGSQRIHSYDMLLKNMKLKKINSKGMESYLDNFRSGMPPHGGWGMGSERVIQLILNLASVKEASLFPRDVKRLSP